MADGQDGEAGDDTEMLIPCHYSTSKDDLPDQYESLASRSNRARSRKLKNPRKGNQFTHESEILVMTPDVDISIESYSHTTSESGSEMNEHYAEMSPVHSPTLSSSHDDSDGPYSLSPFARLKLKRKVDDPYLENVLDNSNNNRLVPVGSYQSFIHNDGPSAFRKVGNSSHSSQCISDGVTSNAKTTMNLIKLEQIKSTFSLAEERDIPSSAFSIGQMFALKKRIIKREAMNMELNHSESGSDGLSEPSLDDSSPELKDEVADSYHDNGKKLELAASNEKAYRVNVKIKLDPPSWVE